MHRQMKLLKLYKTEDTRKPLGLVLFLVLMVMSTRCPTCQKPADLRLIDSDNDFSAQF
jgi:hypothetical protein